ncbi:MULTISPECIES: TolC family outer membrane protein [unclassified Pseudodesulfovibrio]|uniref:TolC family outer membrane protein n=1 Tax=unclassified Pseudodesulfovibrio TaxID=2661612 RepID=UPI000FEB8399|nr:MULTISPECIES: TolC family outer membrane protein [unclassified Pseudodesulfovibrio]MCJ2163466.1 TolC family outer membrane protein [Pseudodesulfovibrio sp. S3-i]RWU06703.1 channel protein TolC [Pseudodesulfovibrio sp. S3]
MKKFVLALIVLSILFSVPAFADNGTTTLKDSVVAAVKQHPQIKSLLYNRDAVSKAKLSALGRFFPSLDLAGEVGYQEYSSAATRADSTDTHTRTPTDVSLTLTQPIFDGFDRWEDFKREGARLTSAEGRLIDNVETVALDAIRAHVDVVRIRRLVALAGDNITAHQSLLDSITERVEGGAGNRADEMQAKGRVARAETTLVNYVGELRTAEAEYIRTVGVTPEVLGEPDYNPSYIPGTPDQILALTLENNPKIAVYKAEIEVAERTKGQLMSTMYPQVDAYISSRHTDNLDGVDSWVQNNKAMLSANWNLINGGSDYNDVRTAAARINEAQADLQDTTDDLIRQVASAWAEYESSIGQIEKYQEALQYSLESLDMYLMQFNVGQRSLLDVLDATNEVFSNKVQLETATSNRNYTLYKFLALEGQIMKTMEIASSTYEEMPEGQ